MRVESRIPFKRPGLTQKQVSDAQIGFKVENLGFGRSSLQNINVIDNFPLFFSYINTEYRRTTTQIDSSVFDLHPIDVFTDLLIHIISIVNKDDSLFEPRNIDRNMDFSYNILSKQFEGGRFGKIVDKKKHIDTPVEAQRFLAFLSSKDQSLKVYESERNLYNLDETDYQFYDWEDSDFEFMSTFENTFQECLSIIEIDEKTIACKESNSKIINELSKFDINADGMNSYMNNRFLALMYILNVDNIYEIETLDNRLDPLCKMYFPFLEYDAKQPLVEGGAVPQETKAVPQETKAVPQETKAVPQETKAVPQETKAVPQETKAVPQETKAVPQETKAVPQETKAVPQETKAVPQETKAVPQETKLTNNGDGINYDLFASLYIQKAVKLIWVMYLLKNKLKLSFENFAMEQLFNIVTFIVHCDSFGPYILDQTCIMVSIYCYLKICTKHKLTPKVDLFAAIIFAPYYVLFI
jgi:hypothetical protein